MKHLDFLGVHYSPTLSLYLDTRYQKKNGSFPIKLKVTYRRKTKFYPMGYEFTKQQYSIIKNFENVRASKKLNSNDFSMYLSTKEKIDEMLLNAKIKAENLKIFTFEDFESIAK